MRADLFPRSNPARPAAPHARKGRALAGGALLFGLFLLHGYDYMTKHWPHSPTWHTVRSTAEHKASQPQAPHMRKGALGREGAFLPKEDV